VINDPRQVEVLIAHALPEFISNMIIVCGVIVMLLRINVTLTLVAIVPVPFIVYASKLYSKKVAPLFRINQEVLAEINAKLQENLSGMREIQAFNREEYEVSRLSRLRDKYADVNIRANFVNGLYHPGVELLTSIGIVVVFIFSGHLAMNGEIKISDIIGFFMYLGIFYKPIATLARLVEDIQTAYAGAVRVFAIIDANPDIVDIKNAVDFTCTDGLVEFNNICFNYVQNETILEDVCFTVKRGEVIAIIGQTGVGKTTIVSLLERFYEPSFGNIKIDGVDIADMSLQSLRSQVSLVSQDVNLFNGTIIENISYGKPSATYDEIINAAIIAEADEFIMAMPDGYNSIVGERGTNLSVGQMQRISIARAVLRDAPILILDEATASVDIVTELNIFSSINTFISNKTVIIIAHRLSTVKNADTILVMKDGKIAERGNHENLLNHNGIYASLINDMNRENI
jgi:ABC-type multidrug transport system fused ATPase/permease subunit